MSWLVRFWQSTIGAKFVMAVTGVILYGFVVVHMLGNLNVFLGEEAMNHYAATLRLVPELLWAIRGVLLLSLVGHVASWVVLARRLGAARPIAYQRVQPRASTLASRTMRVTGPLVLAYLVYHLLHLTFGVVHPDFRELEVSPDAFHNLTVGLSNPLVALVYIAANLMLGLHLWHGAFSLFKTLGLASERHLRLAKQLAAALTALVVAGNVLIATFVLTGLWK